MIPIQRRAVLQCTMGAFWALSDSLSSLASSITENGSRRLDWAEFIGKIATFAERRSRGDLNSTAFVRSVTELGTSLNLTDKELTGAYSFIRKRQESIQSHFSLVEAHRQVTFDVVLLSLAPNYSIPLHDHPGRTGVSVCITGQAMIRNYDLIGPRSSPVLKLRSHSIVRPSEAVGFTDTEGNIHTITAREHTDLVDIFSPPSPRNGGFQFYRAEPYSQDGTLLKVISIS
jgi:hypothetical protein